MRLNLPSRIKENTPAAVMGLVLILLAILPLIGVPRVLLLYCFLFFVYLSMVSMWNFLVGYCGMVSLCQPAFIGLAGYVVAILSMIGVPIFLGVICGVAVAGIVALLISIPALRLKGIYFAIGTLIVPEILRIVFYQWHPISGALGGGSGYLVRGADNFTSADVYWMALTIGIASLFVVRFILNHKLGMGLAAIRDNDLSAASSGINVFKTKMAAFVISALITGMAGCVFYIYQGYIEPNSAFNLRWTTILIVATIIGGAGTQVGPVIGTFIVVMLQFVLADLGQISLLIQGIILVGIVLLIPKGIVGFLRQSKLFAKPRVLATPKSNQE